MIIIRAAGIYSVIEDANQVPWTGSYDHSIRSWDVEAGYTNNVLLGHCSTVSSLHFLENYSVLISASWDYNIGLWDPKSGKNIRMIKAHSDQINSLSTHDNNVISGSNDGTVSRWDFRGELSPISTERVGGTVFCVQIHPTNPTHWFAAASNGTRVHFDPDSTDEDEGKQLRIPGIYSNILSCCFDHSFFHLQKRLTSSLGYNPRDDSIFAGADDSSLVQFDVKTRKQINKYTDHQLAVTSLTVNKENTRLYSGSHDGTIREWDLAKNKNERTFERIGMRVNIAYLGKDMLYCGSDEEVLRLWKLSPSA